MDAAERNALIEQYGRGFEDLQVCLAEIPAEMWQFKPEPTEWSVHEIIVHLADSETNSALRARMLISQPGESSILMAYDQDKWVTDLDYHGQSWQDALEGLKWARTTTHQLIKDQPDAVWQHSVKHPEFDDPFTYEIWLKVYAAHIPDHIAQIKENQRLWQEQK